MINYLSTDNNPLYEKILTRLRDINKILIYFSVQINNTQTVPI